MVRKRGAKVRKIKKILIFWVIIIYDTMFGILYLRDGFHLYNGIPKKIFWIFALSVLGSTLSITLGVSGVIEIIKLIF